ncbi:hypothetical protein EUGRSUZ_I00863 [Eucalyptus grandis]|uniref:Uncharacterized protein n=2 Tax=Eucalyptus grandis TaxID=71139 RepID=A0ACC3JD83_EUCGR|nr:hypothetical protein EUGRSUZ_I00863 [Eucalyptus grandis]
MVQGGRQSPPTSTAASWWTSAISQRYQHLLDMSLPLVSRCWRWRARYLVRRFRREGVLHSDVRAGHLHAEPSHWLPLPSARPGTPGTRRRRRPVLPTRGSDEFRPFVRRLPELKCRLQITWAFETAFVMMFFSVVDVPVFWPVLLSTGSGCLHLQ